MGEQLPSHSPDPGTWQRLSAKLDALDAEAAYQEKLQGLPVHSPDEGTWSIIASRLNRIAYYKTGIRIALSAAAGLLLFLTVSRISDQYQATTKPGTQVARQEQAIIPAPSAGKENPVLSQENSSQGPNKNDGNKPAGNKAGATSTVVPVTLSAQTGTSGKPVNITASATAASIQQPTIFSSEPVNLPQDKMIIPTNEIPALSENIPDPLTQNGSEKEGVIQGTEAETAQTAPETRSILFQKEPYAVSPPPDLKYYAPTEPKPAGNKNNFALAMGYFPENMDNGTNTSLFHNVDLTASYNKEKVRFNTSFGMAYNEEQLQFEVNYDINTPVTAMGPGGKLDTLSFNNASMESEYLGTAKHKYVTYNLGFGRRLFSAGKFSTWISAGAGFGIKLQDPDLVTSTANSVKGQFNAQNVSVSSSGPVYNDVNVNFVTGIDFNYNILSKLSISFAPVSRWYFKPVLSKNNEATDELTLGFRTGLKFEF